MGLLDDIAAVEHRPPSLDVWLQTAPDVERDAVLNFIKDRTVSLTTVGAVLRKNGIRVGDSVLKGYRESS